MIDVIIPAFNAHETIEKTLLSILIQSYKDKVCVYIVDDKSDNDYSKIVNKFKDYLNIKLLRLKTNKGPAEARNYGLKHSKNDYIIFIDSDDVFYNHYSIEILYKNIIKNNYDLIVSSFIEEINKQKYITHENTKIWNHGKIYKREFLTKHNITFLNISTNEDLYFNFLIFMLEPRVKYINELTYVWKNNPSSITRKNNHEYNYTAIKSYNKCICETVYALEKRNAKKENIANVSFFGLLQIYYTYLSYSKQNNKPVINEIYKYTKQNIDIYYKYQKYLKNENKNHIISEELQKYVNNNLSTYFLPDKTFQEFIKEVEQYEE